MIVRYYYEIGGGMFSFPPKQRDLIGTRPIFAGKRYLADI